MNRKHQKGLSLIGFLLLLAAALFVTYIGMKLVPIYLNHYSVVSAMKGVAEEPGIADMSPARVRDLLFRRLTVNYVTAVKPEHVQIIRSTGRDLVVEYEVREPMIGNIDVVVKFSRVQSLD